MPFYEYYCPSCDKEFQLRRPMGQYDESAKCPDCRGQAKKLLSNFAAKLGYYLRPASHSSFRQHS